MRKIAILGIGQIKIDEHWDLSLRELGGNAAFAAMQDAGMDKVDALFVGNMLSSNISGQNQLGTFFSDWIGLWGQEAVKVEAACASGLMAVASGEIDSALVVGVEKMTDKAGRDVTSALAAASDADYELEQGISFVGINALVMRRYIHEFGWKHEDFAPFSINSHALRMIVSVRNPRKSTFKSPMLSTISIGHCEADSSTAFWDARASGVYSSKGLSAIRTPAACVLACREIPSSCLAVSSKFRM